MQNDKRLVVPMQYNCRVKYDEKNQAITFDAMLDETHWYEVSFLREGKACRESVFDSLRNGIVKIINQDTL